MVRKIVQYSTFSEIGMSWKLFDRELHLTEIRKFLTLIGGSFQILPHGFGVEDSTQHNKYIQSEEHLNIMN